jgi:hypothetical protein
VRVRFHEEGGLAHFPGRARVRELDADPELAAALEAALREPLDAPQGRPDARSYVIEVEQGDGWRRVALGDPLPARWAEIVRRLRAA